jgi:hypothetical protein
VTVVVDSLEKANALFNDHIESDWPATRPLHRQA